MEGPDLSGRTAPGLRWFAPVLVAIMLLLWEVAAGLGWISTLLFPPPSQVVRTLVGGLAGGRLLGDVLLTLGRVVPGLLLGAVPGALIGLGMGRSSSLRRALDPFVAALHPVPKLALLPLVMVLIGFGESAKILTIALAAFFPMLINAMEGVRQLNPIYFEVAHSFGARRRDVVRRILLPGSLPMLFAGLRLAGNNALLFGIAIEMIASTNGLGGSLWLSWQVMRVDLLYATLVLVALLGIGFNTGLSWTARRLVPWQPAPRSVRALSGRVR